ncbi:MAG: sulfotransferase [Gammaproteobacteria bacterium]|jgi:tetratricopeptide (TPR) repeat protein
MAASENGMLAKARGLLADGRLGDALRLLQRILAEDPGCSGARRLRGEIAIREGRLQDARADLEAVVGESPDDPSALHALAGVCHGTGDSGAAFAHLQRALELQPDNARLWQALGLVCHGAGRYQAALDAYGRALTIEPEFRAALVGAGKVLQLLGDLDTARRMFERALAEDPEHLDAILGLALQEELLGNDGRAMDLLESVRRRRSLPPDLAIPWARLQHRAGRPQDAVTMLEAMLPGLADAQARSQALFVLAHALDDLGQSDRAFSAVADANALKPRDFDAAAHRGRLRGIAAAWTREALGRLQGWGSSSARPVFIVGMPRSGTSLVEQILSRHPGVRVCGELGAVGILAGQWQDDSGVVRPGDLTPEGLRAAAEAYLDQAGAGGPDRFTDKMPANFLHLGLIQAMLPGSRVIHCSRDPLDTCLSCYFQDFSALGLSWSCRLEDIAAYYLGYRELMEHWRATIDLPLLELRYEDLVAGLEAQVHRVLDFLELPWDPACLSFQDSERAVITASSDQVRRGLYKSAVGRHRAYRQHLGPLLRVLEGAGDGQ